MLWLTWLITPGIIPVAAEAVASESVDAPATAPEAPVLDTALDTALEATLIEQSPVLQRWLVEPPDVLDLIRNTPAVPLRLRVGAASATSGSIGFEDLALGTRLTLSGDYRWQIDTTYDYGLHLRYYLRPRGERFNLAPEIGFRDLNSPVGSSSGLAVGLGSTISLAPGAADLSLNYRLLNIASDRETTFASATAAYSLSRSFRLAAQYSWINAPWERDHRVGLLLEWAP